MKLTVRHETGMSQVLSHGPTGVRQQTTCSALPPHGPRIAPHYPRIPQCPAIPRKVWAEVRADHRWGFHGALPLALPAIRWRTVGAVESGGVCWNREEYGMCGGVRWSTVGHGGIMEYAGVWWI